MCLLKWTGQEENVPSTPITQASSLWEVPGGPLGLHLLGTLGLHPGRKVVSLGGGRLLRAFCLSGWPALPPTGYTRDKSFLAMVVDIVRELKQQNSRLVYGRHWGLCMGVSLPLASQPHGPPPSLYALNSGQEHLLHEPGEQVVNWLYQCRCAKVTAFEVCDAPRWPG